MSGHPIFHHILSLRTLLVVLAASDTRIFRLVIAL